MARANTKIGDVFSVKIDESHKKYFQLVAFDLTQLNSDVIRAFKKVYPINANPDLSEIVNGEVVFYAHCVTNLGLKMKFWEKVGNTTEIGNTTQRYYLEILKITVQKREKNRLKSQANGMYGELMKSS